MGSTMEQNRKVPRLTRDEEIAAHHAATATSHLTQALHWHRFALGLAGDRQVSLARCVEIYAREAGRCARCSRQPPELWYTKTPQALTVHAIKEAFLAGWQECAKLIVDSTAETDDNQELATGVRWVGDLADYHFVKIHRDDVVGFVMRVQDWLKKSR